VVIRCTWHGISTLVGREKAYHTGVKPVIREYSYPTVQVSTHTIVPSCNLQCSPSCIDISIDNNRSQLTAGDKIVTPKINATARNKIRFMSSQRGGKH
jgi:hypothetical protein